MNKKYHLRKSKDIGQLFSLGRRAHTALFQVVTHSNILGHARFVVVAPKRAEKRAVRRNKVRRRTLEWVRRHPNILDMSRDIAIIFKKSAFHATRNTLYKTLEDFFTRISDRYSAH